MLNPLSIGLAPYYRCLIGCKDTINIWNIQLCKSGNDYIINGVQSEFYVAPILWNETCDFLPYKDAFEQFAKEKKMDGLFVALKPQLLTDGHYHFSITTIQDILEQWKEQTK